ncbi:GATA-type domain-containing protein [Aphelenchoides besseyi]|nr:GATA-type domain-containing protein [Aphelenchoides besseyi]KAI6222543.1 GATA-type domain-containing protein [Aphelenchoides besseyi]
MSDEQFAASGKWEGPEYVDVFNENSQLNMKTEEPYVYPSIGQIYGPYKQNHSTADYDFNFNQWSYPFSADCSMPMENQYAIAYDQNQQFQAPYSYPEFQSNPSSYGHQFESSFPNQGTFESASQQSCNVTSEDYSTDNLNEYFIPNWDTSSPTSATTPMDVHLFNQTATNNYSAIEHKPRIESAGRKNVVNQPTKTIKKKVTQNCHQNSVCSNCRAVKTTLWRRNHNGEVECNACNLYYRKNNRRRPEKLQARGIMRRTRNPQQSTESEDSLI